MIPRELHAPDGSSYVESIGRSHTRWVAVHQNQQIGAFRTREEARAAIRRAKGLSGPVHAIERVVSKLEGLVTLTKEEFDKICARDGVDPDSDALVERLVGYGWTFTLDDQYIAPARAEGRWKHIAYDWLDEAPSRPPSVQPKMFRRSRAKMITNPSLALMGFDPPYAPPETPTVVAITTPERMNADGEIEVRYQRLDLASFANQVDAVCFAREFANLFEKYGGTAPGLTFKLVGP